MFHWGRDIQGGRVQGRLLLVRLLLLNFPTYQNKSICLESSKDFEVWTMLSDIARNYVCYRDNFPYLVIILIRIMTADQEPVLSQPFKSLFKI